MFSFIDYTNEVFTISKELGVDVGVAYDMLRADIRSGERANTEAVELPGIDLAAAHGAFSKLTEDEAEAVYGEWHDYMRRCYEAAVAAFPDQDKLAALAAAYRAGDIQSEARI
ncbi:MAG: hypothetical protein ACOX81_10160 [Candidatus Heteroscillospira sp.]|jgi:hypothetical protein